MGLASSQTAAEVGELGVVWVYGPLATGLHNLLKSPFGWNTDTGPAGPVLYIEQTKGGGVGSPPKVSVSRQVGNTSA